MLSSKKPWYTWKSVWWNGRCGGYHPITWQGWLVTIIEVTAYFLVIIRIYQQPDQWVISVIILLVASQSIRALKKAKWAGREKVSG